MTLIPRWKWLFRCNVFLSEHFTFRQVGFGQGRKRGSSVGKTRDFLSGVREFDSPCRQPRSQLLYSVSVLCDRLRQKS